MGKFKIEYVLLFAFILGLTSCNHGPQITRQDTFTSGTAKIAADECLAPIVEEELNVFLATNEEADITPIYTSENNVFDLLVKDSVRLAITLRELTPNETSIIKERKQTPRTQKIAVDGIALIINKANPDSLITLDDVKKIITGEVKSWKDLYPNSNLGEIAIAFDSPNSSTVRFIRDSLSNNKTLSNNVKARSADVTNTNTVELTPNQKVIDFVASTPNALGFIGVNWISNPNDSTSLSFINNIRVMSVSKAKVATIENSFQPYAAYLALNEYPLKRDVYIIITDPSGGLPSGFVRFVAGEKGQRIIHKAGLFPATVPTRLIKAHSDF